MAKKRQTKQGFSIHGFDAKAYQRTESYVSAIDSLYNMAISEFASLASRVNADPNKPFAFSDYPITQAGVQNIVNKLASKMQAVIEKGSRDQWLYACKKNDEFIASIMNTSKISKALLTKMQDRNLDALKTFQSRKVDGLDLSGRVWNYADQFRDTMELSIDVGIGEGRSAQQLAKDLKSNLVNPDKLFRRVRDKRGNLHLSKAAKVYRPGQGVYRSSHKNAMRLTRSEINMAYKESDQIRWQNLEFVVGFEVRLSNNHTLNGKPFKDICDRLVGRYPKNFKFKGWHPQCRCVIIPILQDPDEFDKQELEELRAAFKGTEYKKYSSRNLVKDVPDNFKEWIEENKEKAKGWSSQPYFIRDNFKGGTIEGGLSIVKPTIIAPSAKENIEEKYDFSNGIEEFVRQEVANEINRSKSNITGYTTQIEVFNSELSSVSKNLSFDRYIKNYKIGDSIPKTIERETGVFELHSVDQNTANKKLVAEYRKYKSEGVTSLEIEKGIKKYSEMLVNEKDRLNKLQSGELDVNIKNKIILKRMDERADEMLSMFAGDKNLISKIADQIKKEFGSVSSMKAQSTKTEYIKTKEYGKIRVSDHESRYEQDQQTLGGKANENRPIEFDVENFNVVVGTDKNGFIVRIDDVEYYVHLYNIKNKSDLTKFVLKKLKNAIKEKQ